MKNRRLRAWVRILLGVAAAYAAFIGVQATAYGVDLLRTRNMTSEQVLRFFFKSWERNDFTAQAAVLQNPSSDGFNAVEWHPLRWVWYFFDRSSLQVTTIRAANMQETAHQKEENAAFAHYEGFAVYLVDFTVHYRVNPDHGFNEDGRISNWEYTLARKTTSDPWKIVNYGFDD